MDTKQKFELLRVNDERVRRCLTCGHSYYSRRGYVNHLKEKCLEFVRKRKIRLPGYAKGERFRINCGCGGTYTKGQEKKHHRSEKHTRFEHNIFPDDKEVTKEFRLLCAKKAVRASKASRKLH